MKINKVPFNGKTKYCKINGNTGEDFAERRKNGYGGSDAPYLCGVSKWGSTMEMAATKLGMGEKPYPGKRTEKIWLQGHLDEENILEKCAGFMQIDSGFSMEIHPCGEYEWTNDEWPDAKAHIDGILEVEKGRIAPNPKFYIGSKEPNWTIEPDTENHRYVVDAKTCQDPRVPAWDERDDNGVKTGGLKNGACPLDYCVQLHFYMMVCNIDGALIFGSVGKNNVDDYVQVFVPLVFDEGQKIMDTCQHVFDLVKSGRLPKLEDCKDREKSALYLEKLYPKINEHLKIKKLKDKKWEEQFREINAIDSEINKLKASVAAERKMVDTVDAQIKRLREQRKALLLEPIEEIKDRKGCYYTDEYGNTSVVEYVQEMKWDYVTKEFFATKAPELFAEAEKLFTQRKVKYTPHPAVLDASGEAESEVD